MKNSEDNNPKVHITNTELIEYVKTKSIVAKVFCILLIIVIIGCISTLFIIHHIFQNKETISNGVYIKNIDVSGLTRSEAIDKVNQGLDEIMNDTVILGYNNNEYYEI